MPRQGEHRLIFGQNICDTALEVFITGYLDQMA
jgi:hypothetical protein